MIFTRPRRSNGLSAAVSVVRSIASSDATDPIPAGFGRFNDISKENCPLVDRRPKRLVKAPRQRPRRALNMKAKAAIANQKRGLIRNVRDLDIA